jgi:hypothetical protein
MGQSKFQSFLEAWANIAIGFFVGLLANILVLPMFGLHATLASNVKISLVFTLISLVRSYFLRRAFNRFHAWQHGARS